MSDTIDLSGMSHGEIKEGIERYAYILAVMLESMDKHPTPKPITSLRLLKSIEHQMLKDMCDGILLGAPATLVQSIHQYVEGHRFPDAQTSF